MHDLALAEAIAKGPREFTLGGTRRTAYGLTKEEIRKLFHSQGYNTTTGSRWRSSIYEWLGGTYDYYDILSTPRPEMILDKTENLNWSILFCMIDSGHLLDLKLKAEKTEVRSWPTQDYWETARTNAFGTAEGFRWR